MKLIVSIEEVMGGYSLMIEHEFRADAQPVVIGEAVAFTPRQCGKRAGEMIQAALEGKK